jgi:hypothetical protein
MKTLEQKHRETLADLTDVCDPVRDGWTQRIRDRFGDDLEIALAVAVGQLVSASRHVLEDLDT